MYTSEAIAKNKEILRHERIRGGTWFTRKANYPLNHENTQQQAFSILEFSIEQNWMSQANPCTWALFRTSS